MYHRIKCIKSLSIPQQRRSSRGWLTGPRKTCSFKWKTASTRNIAGLPSASHVAGNFRELISAFFNATTTRKSTSILWVINHRLVEQRPTAISRHNKLEWISKFWLSLEKRCGQISTWIEIERVRESAARNFTSHEGDRNFILTQTPFGIRLFDYSTSFLIQGCQIEWRWSRNNHR